MPKDYSPFTPGQPVPIEFFIGRLAEVSRLTDHAARAAAGRLQVAFLSGERGIGKSSLASFVRIITERDHGALGLHAFLGGVSSMEEMARRVFDRLLKESLGKSWEGRVTDFFGNHIKRVGLFGVSVEFGAPEKDLRRMVHDFAPALRNLMERLKDVKKAVFLVLDDINGLASSLEFANWIKSLVDEIATAREPLPLCLVLVGLEERRQSLVQLQPSLARVFDLIEIKAWSNSETRDFFRSAFSTVNVAVDDENLTFLARFAGGLPVLAHEIGDATFKFVRDNRIDDDVALKGVITAAEIIGRKHLEPQVFQEIRSDRYRTILRKIAKKPFQIRFKRAELREHLTSDEQDVLHNFLRRMVKLDVIHSDPEGGRGAYRFTNELHYLYFLLEGDARGDADVEPERMSEGD
ncbi:MAG: ATP-binding protein [Candidatus Tectomicrobia bacterium]|nr:ATP-binding protein [Candidatus Tectomicrobia bacterium]